MIDNFTENDWSHMHDCVLDCTWDTTKTNLNKNQLIDLFNTLPDILKNDAYEYGMNDTVWRDSFCYWYKKNKL